MDLADCIKFANDNPVCFIATTEGDQPRVRAFGMWYADETGFYFQTGKPKPCCRQLENNPKTEVCYYAPDHSGIPGPMLRVAGKTEFVDDLAMKEKLLNQRPFLQAMGITGPDDPNLIIFKISSGECRYWSMDANFQQHEELVKF